ncbi:hypothetical protein D9M69_623340 [compost metagenome]
MRLAKARMEMPRITPGITSGSMLSNAIMFLPGNSKRSSRNALQVPTPTESSVTHSATQALTPMLCSSSASCSRPVRASLFAVNQSSVKPIQGGVG